VALAGGCRFQLDASTGGAGDLWVLPLCLMLSLVLGLLQVRLRSYLFCSLAVWLVLAQGLIPGLQASGQAVRVVLLFGGFTLALMLHRGVALARRRRVAAATTLATLAYQDALTGLANRRGFLETAAARLKTSQPQGLIALDVDDFKRINDRHGHEVGDRLLQAVGGLLLRLPAQALSGRTGGEEFCVLIPVRSPAELALAAAGVVEAARRLSAQGVGLTLSAGAAQVLPGESLEQALRRADAALGQAKRTGKNRLVLADEAPR
jgi:diguanylate cyclase (GGDEF)-like protein